MKRLGIALVPVTLAMIVSSCADSTTNSLGPTTPSSAAAAKPPAATTLLPASVTLADRSGDAIRSDGGGAYVDGGGLEVGFYTLSRDLVLKGSGRTLNLNSSNRISGSGPTGTTQVTPFLNVHGILDMVRGESRMATVAVKRTQTEVFRFNPTYTGATTVRVVRDLTGVWTVTADDPDTNRAALMKNDPVLGIYALPFQLTAVCPTCS